MLKRVLVIILCVAVIISLVGCKNTAGSSETEPTENAPEASGDKVIKVAAIDCWVEWLTEKAAEYESANPGTKVEVVEIVINSDMYSKITMMMKSAQTAPDLITEDGFMVKSDAAGGYLEPLTDVLANWDDAELFIPAIMEGAKGEDGVHYAVPLSTDVQGIWYNKQLFEQAGLPVPFEPKSWEDVLNAAKTLKGAITTEDFIPLYIYASKTYPEQTSMRTFQTFYFGTGADASLYDMDAGKWVVDKAKLLDVFNFVNTIYNTEKVGPTPSFAGQAGVTDLFQSDYMKNGKVGIYFSGSWEAGNWAEGASHEWEEGLDVWGFANIPSKDGGAPEYTTMSGGWTWAIPANANNKDGGTDFLKFICNKENQLDFAILNGVLAVRSDVMNDPTYLGQDMSVVGESNDMLQYTHFRPSVDGYSQISTVFTEVVESIAIGAATPEEALATLESEIIRLVGEDKVIVK